MDLDEPEEVRMNDLFLYPFCLRAILRIAKLAGQLYQPDLIRRALLDFDQEVPHSVEIRDVLEHYDEYVLGTGKLQRKDIRTKEPGDLPWMLTITRTYIMPDTCVLSLGGILTLDIKEASQAALRLSTIVLSAIPESGLDL
jgi:hypothetical protein